jgi:hypothetical protein
MNEMPSARVRVELADRHHFRSFQPPAVAPRSRPLHVLRNGDQQSDDEDDEYGDQRRAGQVEQRLVSIDPDLEIRMQPDVTDHEISPHEPSATCLPRELRQAEVHLATRRRNRHHLLVNGQTTSAPGLHQKQPVAARLNRERAGQGTADVRRQVELL